MLSIEPFESRWISQVKELTDQEIGLNYYTALELEEKMNLSILHKKTASFVLLDNKNVVAVRLTFPHGCWKSGKGQILSERLWPHPLAQTAYFQSLFIKKEYRGKGWGKALSLTSIGVLKELGCQGVVCHSWAESPQNSSKKYLDSLGFKSICTYPEYWSAIDYQCPRCGTPCLCTAEEMYLDFKEENT